MRSKTYAAPLLSPAGFAFGAPTIAASSRMPTAQPNPSPAWASGAVSFATWIQEPSTPLVDIRRAGIFTGSSWLNAPTMAYEPSIATATPKTSMA